MIKRLVGQLGHFVIAGLAFVGRSVTLTGRAFAWIARGHLGGQETINQMASVGANSIPLVMLTVGFTGAVMALHTVLMIIQLGAQSYIGKGVALTVLREIGPTIAAVVIAARVGASIAAELGTMKVTEQIDALESLAIDPVRYLVVPRLIACVTMMVVLTSFAYLAGIYGAYIVSVTQGVNPYSFWEGVQEKLVFSDTIKGLFKGAVFGFIIAITSCERGLGASKGARGVGNAVTSSVVLNIVQVFVVNFFLGYVLWVLMD
jgi:phospholipid/cholesterol/gamma-HCH transport system permease protein